MRSEAEKRQFAELIADEPPKRRPGRPPGKPRPETFEGAMDDLTPTEAEFVRHVLAGKDQKEAYALTHPDSRTPKAQQKSGSLLASRKRVRHALTLGRQAGAVQAIAGIKYDLTAAHDEIDRHIAESIKQENMNAVASLMREKLKLHRLTDSAPAAAAGAAFTLVIKAADGGEQVIQRGHVIDVQPREDEEQSE